MAGGAGGGGEDEQGVVGVGLDQFPVVNLRPMDVGRAVSGGPEQTVALDDQLAEMNAVREEGLIGGIGLSSITLDVTPTRTPEQHS